MRGVNLTKSECNESLSGKDSPGKPLQTIFSRLAHMRTMIVTLICNAIIRILWTYSKDSN